MYAYTHASYYSGPVWDYFGLTYSNYLVLPRRALQSLPQEWQERFVQLMREAEELLPEEAQNQSYIVRLRDEKGWFTSDPLAEYRHTGPLQLNEKK